MQKMPEKSEGRSFEMSTSHADNYERCLYCGNWHTYSMQMCRDMVTNKAKILEIDKLLAEISRLTKERDELRASEELRERRIDKILAGVKGLSEENAKLRERLKMYEDMYNSCKPVQEGE